MEQNMTFTKKLLAGAFAVAVSAGAMIPAANAEVAASATVATSYLWRGYDLGSGTPAASGDIVFSEGGAYAGLWVSSGDTTAGTEFDLFAGFGGEVEGFSYDISVASYVYPTGDFASTDGQVGDLMEVILTLGYGPVSVSYYDNIAGDTGGYAASEDYRYINASFGVGDWNFAIGDHDFGGGSNDDATHLDVSYSYNDNLSFTVSSWINFTGDEPNPTFVISYSIPID